MQVFLIPPTVNKLPHFVDLLGLSAAVLLAICRSFAATAVIVYEQAAPDVNAWKWTTSISGSAALTDL